MTTTELTKKLTAQLDEAPLKASKDLVRIRDASTGVIAAYQVADLAYNLATGEVSLKADTVGKLYGALDTTRTQALVCAMTGVGMQGPILVDMEGDKWAPTGEIELNPGGRFACLITCNKIED